MRRFCEARRVRRAGPRARPGRSPAPCRRSARRRRRRPRPSTGPRPSSSGTPSGSPPASTMCGPELGADDAFELARVRPRERDLADGGEVEVERLEEVGERLRVAGREAVQQPQHADGPLLVVVLAGQRGEAQQPVGHARVAGRDRVVLEVLAPGDEPLVVGRRSRRSRRARRRRSARSSCRRARARRRTSAARRSPRRGSAAPRAGRRGPRGRRSGCPAPSFQVRSSRPSPSRSSRARTRRSRAAASR